MTGRTQQLRRQTYQTQEVGQLARDTQAAFQRFVPQELRTVEDLYREPMTLGQLTAEPAGIELIRIVSLTAPATPVKSGSMVHFVFRPENGGAVITSIDGLSTVVNTARYRFVFRITYGAT